MGRIRQTTYEDYVNPKLLASFRLECEALSKDQIGCCMLFIAHAAMRELMQHTFHKKFDTISPKEAWKRALGKVNVENVFLRCLKRAPAIVMRYSPRGEEFRMWWNRKASIEEQFGGKLGRKETAKT